MPDKTYSADFRYLDHALRANWHVWQQLESEMASFVPKPKDNYREARDAEIERLQVLNPNSTHETLAERVDRQFDLISSAEWQFRERFESRHMSLYVTVVLLSHALCEALINAALAIGLADAAAADLFPVLERADFRDKRQW